MKHVLSLIFRGRSLAFCILIQVSLPAYSEPFPEFSNSILISAAGIPMDFQKSYSIPAIQYRADGFYLQKSFFARLRGGLIQDMDNPPFAELTAGANFAENWYLGGGAKIQVPAKVPEWYDLEGVLTAACRRSDFVAFFNLHINLQGKSTIRVGAQFFDHSIIPLTFRILYSNEISDSFELSISPEINLYFKPGLSWDFLSREVGIFASVEWFPWLKVFIQYGHATETLKNTIQISTKIYFR